MQTKPRNFGGLSVTSALVALSTTLIRVVYVAETTLSTSLLGRTTYHKRSS